MSILRPTSRNAKLALVALIVGTLGWVGSLGSVSTSHSAVAQVDATSARDPWLRPFASRSIWNMPLGSQATYGPANLPYTKHQALETSYLMRTSSSDPVRPLMSVGSWRDRCSGTKQLGTIHLPNGWQPKPVTARSTPNNPGVFLQPDGRTLVNVGSMARCNTSGALHANRPGTDKHITDLHGDGQYGAHGASRLSQLGGAIRPGELSGDDPIRHALDLLVSSEHLYWGGTKQSSYRWPASSSDRYAGPDRYTGSNPELRMGSLLAIEPGATPASLGITTDVGLKLFDALQNYGAYVTDDSAWDANYIGVDAAAVGTFPWRSSEKADMARMVASLNVVTNNGPQSIGGGGEPRRPLLPEIGVVPPSSGGRTPVADAPPLDPIATLSGPNAAERVMPPAPVDTLPPPPVDAPPVDAPPVTIDATPENDERVIFSDTFDAPSRVALSSRAGPNWTVIGGAFDAVGGAAMVTTSRGSTMALADAATSDVSIASSITLSPGRAAPGLALRMSDVGDGITLSMVVRSGQNRLSLHAVRGGKYTLLAEATDVGLELGATYGVVLRATGPNITVELDGRRMIDHRLPENLVSAYGSNNLHGLRIMSNSTADDRSSRWNDIVVSHP